jgi:hypothetical protein
MISCLNFIMRGLLGQEKFQVIINWVKCCGMVNASKRPAHVPSIWNVYLGV